MIVLLFIILGLIVGSFIGAFTYRLPRSISINKGRSFCPKCKKTIEWYNNIPLLSYLLLGGKCANCDKKISIRYPLIELFIALGFVLIWLVISQCILGFDLLGGICWWKEVMGVIVLPFSLFIYSVLVAIFVVDFEERIIPDELLFVLLGVLTLSLVLFNSEKLFENLLVGFLIGVLFLFIHLVTKGKGLGLGDVKFVVVGGVLLGWPLALVWIFLAFLTGALVGIILILTGHAKFGKQIPFGPFLTATLFVTYLFGYLFIDSWFKLL
jgi:prepilin signal peptidase PulO-like enzyme (type II secretory pathway)